ncbi:serine/threonine protein kinase [Nocardia otitidiscaviarum]|nr:serine/threonine-protein kinase [Nocardia otitidiscaviarum]MCP9620177.1 serine/threonine protein kinase [Nocardia otitidiscaviarum]
MERKLGAGGMGSVYLARHPRLTRLTALKILSDNTGSDDEFRARFLREAELASRLAHPNVVAILDRGVFGESLWIAMQYVDGTDAARLLRGFPGGMPPQRAVHIVTEAARGLDAAHDAGLLHRDVKPANILVSPSTEGPDRVLVTDFGIARALDENTILTAAGDVLATVAYAAPEQLRGEPLDHRVDVYALGATLCELLTGTKPFPRGTAAAVMHAHLTEPPPRPSTVNSTVPHRLDRVIARAMAKDPAQRYQSCGDLAAAANAVLRGEPVLSVTRARRPAGRTVAAVVAAVLALLIGTTAFVLGTDGAGRDQTDSVTTASGAPPVDGSNPWGTAGFVVAAFPDLLPRSPVGSGYRGLWCDVLSTDFRQIPLDVRTPQVNLMCTGDGDPLDTVWVSCLANRLPWPERPWDRATKAGEEAWTRPSGTGRIEWGDAVPAPGEASQGQLRISFDDSDRTFCAITLFAAGASGRQLRDGWWANAPL